MGNSESTQAEAQSQRWPGKKEEDEDLLDDLDEQVQQRPYASTPFSCFGKPTPGHAISHPSQIYQLSGRPPVHGQPRITQQTRPTRPGKENQVAGRHSARPDRSSSGLALNRTILNQGGSKISLRKQSAIPSTQPGSLKSVTATSESRLSQVRSVVRQKAF